MPALLNLANNGQSWVENGIRYERVVKKIGPPIREGCPALWEHMEAELAAAHAAGWYGTRADERGQTKSPFGGRFRVKVPEKPRQI